MRTGERRLVLETPEMHTSDPMQSYIKKEVSRPCKQWIHDVLSSRREADRVKLRTQDFVLLPDVDTFHKRKTPPEPFLLCDSKRQPPLVADRRWRMRRIQNSFHWLAVVADTSLRTLRDLRGEHIPLLTQLYMQACQRIKAETGTDPDQIMAYIHYPPSVYQLHIHFKYPLSPTVSHDTFRIHPLATIINNLHIDGDYYRKSLLQLPVYVNTELYSALGLEPVTETVAGIRPGLNQTTETNTATGGSHQQCPIQARHNCKYKLILNSIEECSTEFPGSRPSTPDPPSETGSSSATPGTPL